MSKSLPCILVGGPIQNAIDSERIFDKKIRYLIESVLKVLDNSHYKIISAHIYENFGKMDVSGKFHEVCARDYQWMQECDMFIAILPLDSNGEVVYSSGTCVELGWASAMKKPIVIVRDQAPKYSHLIAGLGVVTNVTETYINDNNFESALSNAVEQHLAKWFTSRLCG